MVKYMEHDSLQRKHRGLYEYKWNWKLMFCVNLIFDGTIAASEALFRVPIIYQLWLEILVFVPWTQNCKRKLKRTHTVHT